MRKKEPEPHFLEPFDTRVWCNVALIMVRPHHRMLFGTLSPLNAKRARPEPDETAPEQEPSEFRRTFARNLRAAREEIGLSQRELAKLADLSQRYISEIETLAKNVSMDTITALAKHVRRTEIELLTPKKAD